MNPKCPDCGAYLPAPGTSHTGYKHRPGCRNHKARPEWRSGRLIVPPLDNLFNFGEIAPGMNLPSNPPTPLKRAVAARWLANHDPKHRLNQLKDKRKKARNRKTARIHELR